MKVTTKIEKSLRNTRIKQLLLHTRRSTTSYQAQQLNMENTALQDKTNSWINVRQEDHPSVVRKEELTTSLAQRVRVTAHTIFFDSSKVITSIEHRTGSTYSLSTR